jgi:PAS domain S-box-containing protein
LLSFEEKVFSLRHRTVRWSIGVAATAVALWTADAAIRALVLHEAGLVRELFAPPGEVLLARLPLLALGVVVVLSLRGIRQLQDARQESVDERARLRELYDYTNDAIVFLDRDLRIIFMNKAAERIGGTRFKEALGWPCHRAILGSEEPCRGCRAMEVFDRGEPRTATKYEVTPTGQENWLEQRWYPVRDAAGGIEAVLEVAHDITETKQLERELAACYKAMDAKRREA